MPKQSNKPADDSAPVRLTAPYAFYDEDGNLRSWNAGQRVGGEDAALLMQRGAPVEPVH